MKCIKCGIYYKDRKSKLDKGVEKELCLKCFSIWRSFQMLIGSIPSTLGRKVALNLDDLEITKE